MWATSLLTMMLLFPLLSAAPLDIAGGVEDDNDGLHSHDENVTRRGKQFDHNQFDFSVNVQGDVDYIGHEVNIDVHSHADDHHHHEDDTVIECKEGKRVLFKSIDSNNNGIMDAKELLRVCHQNNFQVTESSAVRILTLPDNTVGFNMAKFCELLKDCPSTNSADLIYFLLELYDKVTCPHKDDLSDVLLENHWRTQNQINAMSENIQRNTVIAEVKKMTGHTIEDLQGRANVGNLGSLTAIANMASLLIKKSIKSSSDVETMAYSDLRNALIVEASQRFSIEVSILHSMTDRELLKAFCTGCEVIVGKSTSNTISATVTEGCVCPTVVNTYPEEFKVTQDGSSLQVQRTDSDIGWSIDLSFMCKVTCPHKDDLSSVLLENNWSSQDQINVMSEDHKRNLVITKVGLMTGHTTADLQGRANAGGLGSLTSIANMAALLIKYSIKSSSDVKTMTYEPDLRNALITEISRRLSIQVGTLQSKTDLQLLNLFCTFGTVTCPHKDDLSSVLLENNWSTQDQINVMSEDHKRNKIITGVRQMTGHTTADLQGRANAGGLGSLTSIANMAALLIKYSIKSSSDVKTMTYEPDLRNALITETSRRFSIKVRTLQRMTDLQLLNLFCTFGTVSCQGPATLLSTSPGGDMALCKDKTESTCEKDFESLCPAGWNLCTPGQFNNRNNGWDYNWYDADVGSPLGEIYCEVRDGPAFHYGLYTSVLDTDEVFNCDWSGSSRPGCDQEFGAATSCDNKGNSVLCCAPTSTCGDGEVQEEEDCDDGNNSDMDDCLNTCTRKFRPNLCT